jgi:perosamine synthetase|tara:strand:- start:56 stop:1270 length:1215 start_codon:yes stop_codon:yes gene_type:complete
MKNPTKYYGKELEYLKKVLESENWTSTSGTWNQLLESEFSKKFESDYAIAMNSGTSTLHAALVAVGVKPGDEVISPALTVIMDTSATIHAGAVPVYADIDPETFNIDPDDIERKITSKTKAIIIVPLYGLPCNMDRIMEISEKYNIPVIEDNAQCFLSTYKGKKIGTFGAFASYSFENSKHMSCGEGGILITNNEEYATTARKVSNHGFKNSTAVNGRIKLNLSDYQNPDYKRHDEIGWNYRLSEFGAAIATAQLENLENMVDTRIEASLLFLNTISETECEYLIPQKIDEDAINSFWTFTVVYEGDEKLGVSWKDFREKYVEFGGDGIYSAWSVPYLEPVMATGAFVKTNPKIYKKTRYEKGLCPVAEEIQPKIMQFKNNYRDLELAQTKAEALRKTIEFFRK